MSGRYLACPEMSDRLPKQCTYAILFLMGKTTLMDVLHLEIYQGNIDGQHFRSPILQETKILTDCYVA